MPTWRNWQTRYVQGVVPARECGFKSLRRHHSQQSSLETKEAQGKMKIKRVLADKKENKVCTININDTIRTATKKMTDEDVHALIVIEDNNDPLSYVGIITTIMIIAESWKYDNILEEPVGKIMSHHLLVIKPEDDVEQVMGFLTKTKIRYIPIWEGEKIIGVFSAVDLVRTLLKEKEIQLTSLSDMSGGTYGNKVY